MGFWTAANQAYATAYLVNNGGLSPYGAAGLVSRWANVESIAAGPTAVNPSSGAFGIAQWLGARKHPINGNTSLDAQLVYVIQELNGTESRAGNVLRSASDENTAAIGASMYERAEGYNAGTGRDNFTNRTAAGVAGVLAAYGGGAAADSGSTGPDQSQVSADPPTPNSEQGSIATPLLLLAAGGALLYLLID